MTLALKTLPFDAADAIDTPDAQAELLAEALASGDAKVVTAALGMIARSKGMSQMARDAGISREAIYRATGPDGNPTLSTLMAIVRSAGLKLSAAA
jgi:probable addiction module antidote protein